MTSGLELKLLRSSVYRSKTLLMPRLLANNSATTDVVSTFDVSFFDSVQFMPKRFFGSSIESVV